ncbi:MAG: S-layer homology domain-containing protein [Clostridia bacterium]|nr:S-layer homology domain-containing protein [Clostridia bacterium]
MRNLKSMVAFLVVAAMLFASVTSFAYGDVAADADYATAVEVLSALDILKGDDKGNFNPDNTITRAESAAVIVRLLGLEEAAAGAAGATQFVDVAADHWGSGYINMAAQSGIIAGYGDGNFGPEDAVTYEQFVKMLVCALGYEPKALTKGTYPTGYLIAAKEMKLTKGVSGSAGQEAARAIVAELAYNALDINLMEQSGWGSDISYDVVAGKTLLSEKLEIYKVEATLNSIVDVEKVKLTVEDGDDYVCPTNSDLVIDGTDGLTVLAADIDASLVGYPVEAYLAESGKKAPKFELVAVAKDSDNVVLDLAGEDCTVAGDKSTVTYTDADDEDVVLDVSATGMYINGEWVANLTGLTNGADMAYEFVLNEDEDAILTIFATQYKTAMVSKYDAARERIVLKNTVDGSKYIKLDEDTLEDMTYTLVDVNGAAVEPADLTEDAVLTIKKNTTSIDMVVSTATVEGKVTATSKDEDNVTMYTIGDTKYYKSAAIALFNNFAIKDEGTFYLDAAGKIVNFEAAESTANYAWVYRAQAVAGTDDYTIKVLDKDGLNTYTLAYDTKIDTGATDKVYADVAYALVTGIHVFGSAGVIEDTDVEGNFFEIETNANGVVTTLKAASVDSVITAKYSEALTKMSAFLAEDVLVFNLPEDGELADISVAGLDSLVDDKEYTFYPITGATNDDGEVTAIAIFGGASSATFEAPIAIVTAKDTILDADENEVTELTVLVEGAEAKVTTDATFAIGDVITYVVDGEGKIDAYKKIAAIAPVANSNNVITLTSDATSAVVATTNRIFAYGTIADINNNGIVTLNYASGNQSVTNIKLAEVDTYVVNYNKKTNFAVADAFDLGENEADIGGENADVAHYALFVLDEDENIVSLIIVEPVKDAYENLGL